MTEFKFNGHNLRLVKGKYEGGKTAIVVMEEGSQFAVLTVNLPVLLKNGEFIIKTWSENAPIANLLRESRFFRDTKRRIKTGLVEAEVWEFQSPYSLDDVDQM